MKQINADELFILLSSSSCKRLSNLDIGVLKAYELSDSSILLDLVGESGYIFSRDELEKLNSGANEREKDEISRKLEEISQIESEYKSLDLENLTVTEIVRPNAIVNHLLKAYKHDKSLDDLELEVAEIINFFTNIGFFSNYLEDIPSLSNRILKKVIKDNLASKSEESYLTDLAALKWDDSRVLWKDLEADVCPGNNIYVSVLETLSYISRGEFEIFQVIEFWESAGGPVSISFTFEGKNHEIQPTYMGDWVDINIVRDINNIIEARDGKFEILWTTEQSAFVTMLRKREKKLLKSERGWKFLT